MIIWFKDKICHNPRQVNENGIKSFLDITRNYNRDGRFYNNKCEKLFSKKFGFRIWPQCQYDYCWTTQESTKWPHRGHWRAQKIMETIFWRNNRWYSYLWIAFSSIHIFPFSASLHLKARYDWLCELSPHNILPWRIQWVIGKPLENKQRGKCQ